MLAEKSVECKVEVVQKQLASLVDWVVKAAEQGTSVYAVEKHLFRAVLIMGYHLLGLFFHLVGPGDCGEEITVEEGRTLKRLPKMLSRRLLTVFGEFKLKRWGYGTRPDQKIELVPTDQRIQISESVTSYMLQDLNQMFATDLAFGPVCKNLKRMLGLKQSVDTVERGNRQMAEAAPAFRESQPAPQPENEGELLVVTEDNKGIPMVRPTQAAPAGSHRKKGEKANKKQMACIGCVHTVDRHIRTPEELEAALFRDKKDKEGDSCSQPPKAKQKQYWTELTRKENGVAVHAQTAVFQHMNDAVALRRRPGQIMIHLSDGQISLETDREKHLPRDEQTVDILDLMHVLTRLWALAHLFYAEGSDAAREFVRKLVRGVLAGKSSKVIGNLRRRGTKQGLRGKKAKRLKQLCSFLEKNLHRMRYDEYLRAGYPIATGVIEGACRHVIKDRMERAGMRWTVVGAQAMLQLRAICANDDWDAFQEFRVQYETARLYPYRHLFQTIAWNLTLTI